MREKRRMYKLYESGLTQLSGVINEDYCIVKEMIVSNQSGSALYFQIFDTGSLPMEGSTPRRSWRIDANSSLSVSYLESREYHSGASFSWSDDYATLDSDSITQVSGTLDVDFQSY